MCFSLPLYSLYLVLVWIEQFSGQFSEINTGLNKFGQHSSLAQTRRQKFDTWSDVRTILTTALYVLPLYLENKGWRRNGESISRLTLLDWKACLTFWCCDRHRCCHLQSSHIRTTHGVINKSSFFKWHDSLKRWVSGEEYWLYFQRTGVSQQPTTWLPAICNYCSRGSYPLFWPLRAL